MRECRVCLHEIPDAVRTCEHYKRVMHYNFGRVHQTLRVTPALEAGLADHVRSIEDIVGLLER